ncbi:MAG: hypothetical protein JWN48_2805 [Myxococcaceae bacterium]|nr:hypothetical protein [Myxococcaceae bacterium]
MRLRWPIGGWNMSVVRSSDASARGSCRSWLRAGFRAVATTVLIAGCAEDERRVFVSLDAPSGLDASATMPVDAGADQKGGSDGGQTWSDCMGDELTFALPDSTSRSFSLAVRGTQVDLLYVATGCDGIGLSGDPRGLRHAQFSTSGPLGSDLALPRPACSSVRRPVLLASGSTLSAFFVTRGEQGVELRGLSLPEGTGTFAPIALPALESELAAVTLGATASVVYSASQETSALDAGAAILTTQAGASSEVLRSADPHRLTALAVATSSADASVGGVVLWVDRQAEQAGIFLRDIDATGQGQGEVRTLSRALGSRSTVAAAARQDGALVLYTDAPFGDDKHQLQLRRVDATGALGEASALTGRSEDVGHAAITPYRDGYAVAYRRLGSELNRSASIRLLFVDHAGLLGAGRLVAPTTVSGTAVSVAMASDGRLIVAWDAVEEVATQGDAGAPVRASRLHAARLRCF